MCQHSAAAFSSALTDLDRQRQPTSGVPATVDHHLHIQSPAATEFMLEQVTRVPHVFKGISGALLERRTGADALRVLDEAGIGQAVLLSEAYIFTSPHFLADGVNPHAAEQTRRENQFNVDAALQSEGRLKAFVSVNPLDARAADEVSYWAGKQGVSGLKLHLSNSGFNPESERDIEALGRIFKLANTARLPIIMHARIPAGSPSSAAQVLVDEVLPQVADIPVQLAHAGGEGGLDPATLAVLQVYAAAIAKRTPGTANLLFDLAVVAVRDETEAGLAQTLLQSLTRLMREIGLARFVMGSDWPTVCTPREHACLLEAQYRLAPDEWSAVLRNRAPYMDSEPVVGASSTSPAGA